MAVSAESVSESTAYLFALDSCFTHREYIVPTSGLIIGRDHERSDIVVSDKFISRRHVAIQNTDDGHFLLLDLGSKNGVYVNKHKVHSQVVLQDQDVIGLGSPYAVHLRFQHQSSRNKTFSQQLPKKDSWTIGRSEDSDICLSADSTVSGLHARIAREKGHLVIQDMKSLNGTYLNGRKVRKAKVLEPDTVVIGSSYFHFRLTESHSLLVSLRECGDNIQLECIGLNRDVTINRRKSKRILHDISLQIKPGEFVGILGPSGAGKSTLLKSICGHTPPDEGCVLLNETPMYRSFDMFRSNIGYVPQDDILHLELSVEKSLEYVARLRLPKDTDSEQRDKIVQTTIEELGLSHVKNNKIEELSGGQRKRVSIGAELITRPSVLFLDEPTSGLDPSVEERLMRHFQDMAQKGTTILITTHILYNLSMLDKIIFMAQGRLVFYGTPDEALEFFNDGSTRITRQTQIFDLLEGLLEDDSSGGGRVDFKKKETIAEYYSQKYVKSSYCKKHLRQQFSTLANDMYAFTEDKEGETKDQNKHMEELLTTPQKTGWDLSKVKRCFSPRQWNILSSRHLHIRLFSVKQCLIFLLIPIILSCVTLTQTVNGFVDEESITAQRNEITSSLHHADKTVELQLQKLLTPEGSDEERSAAELMYAIKHEGVVNLPVPMGMLLMFVMTSIFMGTFIACQEISPERSIRYREQMAGQRVFDYIGSKLSFCLLVTAIQCTLYLGLCYLSPGLRPVNYFDILQILIIISWTSVAMGLFLSSIDPSSGHFSIIFAIVIVLPQLILSGGLGPDFYDGMNEVSQVTANFFPARWGLELLMSAVYFSDAGDPFTWIPKFVTNDIGFDFGEIVFRRDMLILLSQMTMWLLAAALAIKAFKKR